MKGTLWEKGVFSRNSAQGLLNIVYFYNCKVFKLRAGDEHQNLNVEQFCFGVSNDNGSEHLKFVGCLCKTYQGRLKHRKLLPNKTLKVYSVPELL